jgi:hypothetical protein
MKNLNILKKLIAEEVVKVIKECDCEMENYMFFQNIKTIHEATKEILEMDPEYVDSILSDGHQWAVDHIATSADDVEEVYHFLSNRNSEEMSSMVPVTTVQEKAKNNKSAFTSKYNEFGDGRDELPDNLQRIILNKK